MTDKKNLISKWERKSCIKYKLGSVMIVENNTDVNRFDNCNKPIKLSDIQKNKVYQYIISEKEIKIMPTMRKNEIGSKHDCLIRHFEDDDIIIASGELIKKGNIITYSCMSSLFMTLMGILYTKEKIKPSERQDYKDNYEKNVSKEIQKYFKNYKINYVKNIEFGRKQKFNPEKLCKYKNPPKCLRYMKNKDCPNQANNPNGTDCNVGVDFCRNLNIKSLPDVIIPESQYIYQETLDMGKVKEHFKSKGKTNLKPMALKLYMNRDEEFDEKDFMNKELFWPVLEKS